MEDTPMPYATFSTPVNAPLATVWALLLDKIEDPQRYISAVQHSAIRERFSDGVLREMQTAQMQLTERITIDESSHTISFTLVDHPQFSGAIRNTVAIDPQAPETATVLTFTLDWSDRQPGSTGESETALAATLKQALLDTKALAEARASAE
jgi:hypothetical protein